MKKADDPSGTDSGRRRLLKATGVAGVAAIVLPKSWTKPIMRAIVVPAHAQTTPVVTTTTGTSTTSTTGTGTTTVTTTTATTASGTTSPPV